jgi:hypothetical protein
MELLKKDNRVLVPPRISDQTTAPGSPHWFRRIHGGVSIRVVLCREILIGSLFNAIELVRYQAARLSRVHMRCYGRC